MGLMGGPANWFAPVVRATPLMRDAQPLTTIAFRSFFVLDRE